MKKSKCNLRITSQYPFCCNPLSIDTYRGCTHHCEYCFASDCVSSKENFFDNVTLADYKPLINKINNKENEKNLIDTLINKKQPIHLGGMADPFPIGVEEITKHTKGLLENIGNYPLIISTKNPMYPELMDCKNIILQCSIIGFGEIFRRLEPNVKSGEDRIEALKEFKGRVKKIVIRMQPFIPWLYTDKSLDEYMKRISVVADAVTIEFLHLGNNYNKKLDNIFGFNTKDKIIEHGVILSSEAQFNDAYKIELIKKIRDIAHKYNIEFYCAENTLRDYGDGLNCCGVCNKDDIVFQSKNDRNTGRLLFELKEKKQINVKEWINNNIDKELYKKYIMSKNINNGCNKGDAVKYAKLKNITLYDKIIEIYLKKNSNNPAIMYKNVKMKIIDGEAYFIYIDDEAGD